MLIGVVKDLIETKRCFEEGLFYKNARLMGGKIAIPICEPNNPLLSGSGW